ncbi:hypothetical protein BP6252_13204 [Coleophoma cylindrospora]|uniref:TauD/TfdA-like domain-containing protein n=1 Tax=Coleophoma cylindrospora TaxID=1849047 RepID=A0A3D8QAT7_9HELO|nr:hypothetical protein BP6252_13204 [Coleophoma cylindrospora]
MATLQSNGSSSIDLSLHVENAYFGFRPDFLLLYCLRQDAKQEARTSVVDIRCALAKLDPHEVAELQKPVFMVPSPPSHHGAMGGERWSDPRPVFGDLRVDPNFICHFPGMKALEPMAQRALDRFEEVVLQRDIVRHIAVQPGGMLLLNNRKVAHGRSSFEARYDGSDRWLQRVYVTRKRSSYSGEDAAGVVFPML